MDKWENKFVASMTRRYAFALGLLALIAFAADYVLQKNIETELSRAAVINSAGRLRMLSQRIALFAMRLAHADSQAVRLEARTRLQQAIADMELSFHGLLHGDAARRLPGNPSARARAIYFGAQYSLNEDSKKFFAAAKAVAQAPEAELHRYEAQLQYLFASAASDFLEHSDELVQVYQKESEAGIARLQKLERLVMLITVFVLALMAVLTFRPMVRRIHEHFLERGQAAREREKLIADLRTALANVKTLSGLIPICSGCKKIRDDRGYWNQLEAYLERHSNADFTHGFCPECQKSFEES
jgi:nitrate/nitrite-specific signal transduction histidine kinase